MSFAAIYGRTIRIQVAKKNVKVTKLRHLNHHISRNFNSWRVKLM